MSDHVWKFDHDTHTLQRFGGLESHPTLCYCDTNPCQHFSRDDVLVANRQEPGADFNFATYARRLLRYYTFKPKIQRLRIKSAFEYCQRTGVDVDAVDPDLQQTAFHYHIQNRNAYHNLQNSKNDIYGLTPYAYADTMSRWIVPKNDQLRAQVWFASGKLFRYLFYGRRPERWSRFTLMRTLKLNFKHLSCEEARQIGYVRDVEGNTVLHWAHMTEGQDRWRTRLVQETCPQLQEVPNHAGLLPSAAGNLRRRCESYLENVSSSDSPDPEIILSFIAVFKTFRLPTCFLREYRDAKGNTLLHYACKSRNLPLVEYCLEKDASLSQICNHGGKRPEAYCRTLDVLTLMPDVRKFYRPVYPLGGTRKRFPRPNRNMIVGLYYTCPELAHHLSRVVGGGTWTCINLKDVLRYLPFVDEEMIRRICREARDSVGNTLWHYAAKDMRARNYHGRIYEEYLDKSILNVRNDEGEVPLHLNISLSLKKCLIEWGCHPCSISKSKKLAYPSVDLTLQSLIPIQLYRRGEMDTLTKMYEAVPNRLKRWIQLHVPI